MKNFYTFILTAAVFLFSCAGKLTAVHSAPEPDYTVLSPEPSVVSRLTDKDSSAYSFYADMVFYDRAAEERKHIGGFIENDSDIARLWEYLAVIEAGEPIQLDENDTTGGGGSDFTLTLTDKQTGALYTVSGGILYDNPYEEGGPSIIVVGGVSCGGRSFACYGSFWEDETEYSESGLYFMLLEMLAP